MDKHFVEIVQLLKRNIPFACYHLPNSNEVNFVFQSDRQPPINNSKRDTYKQQFIINSWNNERIIINGHKVFKLKANELSSIDFPLQLSKTDTKETTKSHFLKLANQIIKTTLKGNFSKIVASRVKLVEQTGNFKIFTALKKMITNYPSAFSYLFYLPKTATCWMGATPETLLTTSKKTAKTMALAGTQKYAENLIWQQKEIDEQQFVTDYLVETLTTQNLTINLSEPYTKKAANLAHLCTEIEVSINDSLALEKLVDTLHPTPAVAGIPKKQSIEFINQFEDYERSFYTGYIGIKKNDELNLFVNLRCMQLFTDQIAIYVGAGITKDSNAKMEWEETELKAQTMLSIIFDEA